MVLQLALILTVLYMFIMSKSIKNLKDDPAPLAAPIAAHDKPRVRKCLTCREPFESEWSGNRVCKRCKASAAWRQGG